MVNLKTNNCVVVVLATLNKLARRVARIIKDSVGVFLAKYTLPVGVSSIVYEFSGIDGDGQAQLSRKR